MGHYRGRARHKARKKRRRALERWTSGHRLLGRGATISGLDFGFGPDRTALQVISLPKFSCEFLIIFDRDAMERFQRTVAEMFHSVVESLRVPMQLVGEAMQSFSSAIIAAGLAAHRERHGPEEPVTLDDLREHCRGLNIDGVKFTAEGGFSLN